MSAQKCVDCKRKTIGALRVMVLKPGPDCGRLRDITICARCRWVRHAAAIVAAGGDPVAILGARRE